MYNDAKAEQKFHVLMNAAVSHELRNPLNSLISGIDTMQDYFNNL
jgi:signal transduction histidine kinase